MQIVSVTLTGNNDQSIGNAISSVVDWVDICLVIDTGVSDRSLEIASTIAQEKYVERQFKWINDFSAARNFSLAAATELGGDWAIIVDTDEQIYIHEDDLRKAIQQLEGDVFLASEVNGFYHKERLFKLPILGRYIGPTHEYFDTTGLNSSIFKGISFSELPKSKRDCLVKFHRDREILKKVVQDEPLNPRWHFYLGETLRNLAKYQDAVVHYRECANLSLWDEEAAWACFREGECWVAIKHYQQAIDACVKGLAKHAGMTELAWLAGYASYYSNLYSQALRWAKMAIEMGKYQGYGHTIPRFNFQYQDVQYEKPFDLLKYALLALGDYPGADLAEKHYQAAYLARMKAYQNSNQLGNNSYKMGVY